MPLSEDTQAKMPVCSESCIVRHYRLFTAIAYFLAFCCQIPLLVVHLPLWIGVETSFNTYTPAVSMVIIGCAFFIVDRIAPKFGDKFRLQLWSGLLLMIGSSVWCICGISWSTRLCEAIFDNESQLVDQCWATTFINFLAVSCSVLYLTMSVIDDLFSPKARFVAIVITNVMLLLHLVLYLVLHAFRRIETMSIELQFYYYILIASLVLTTTLSLTYCVCGHPQISSFGVVFYCGLSGFFTLFLVCYGSLNFWLTQSLNVGDAAAFIGYTIFYTSANIWIFIELRLYQIYRLQTATRSMYQVLPTEDDKVEAKLVNQESIASLNSITTPLVTNNNATTPTDGSATTTTVVV